MLMLLSIGVPLCAGGLLMFLRPAGRRERLCFVMCAALLTTGLAFAALLEPGEELTLLRLSSTLSLSLRVDGLSAVFGGMVAALWPVACLYAGEYMAGDGRQNRFFAFYLGSFGVTLGVAFSANILTLYLFYELLTLATLPLVMHEQDGKARFAGKSYLIYSMSGAALGFVAMVLIMSQGAVSFQFGGSIPVSGETDGELVRLAYALGFFGFGVKAAVFPGHLWLLRAAVAPTPVTALLHAVAVVKAGVFAVARLTWYGVGVSLLRDTWVQTLVMAAAMVTIVAASTKALGTEHLKRRLAWSTVSNLSYVLLGVTAMTAAGLVAGMTHMVFHGVIKITLFFCAGAIHHKMHRDTVPEIEGCGVLMPAVFSTFAIAALSLMGIPPLVGFSSKWMLATSLAGMGEWRGFLGAAALIVSALFTALYLMQIVLLAFFPRQNRQLTRAVPSRARRDPNLLMTLPLLVLTAAMLVMSVLAKPLTQLISTLILG